VLIDQTSIADVGVVQVPGEQGHHVMAAIVVPAARGPVITNDEDAEVSTRPVEAATRYFMDPRGQVADGGPGCVDRRLRAFSRSGPFEALA
jgi:hypothetical protein